MIMVVETPRAAAASAINVRKYKSSVILFRIFPSVSAIRQTGMTVDPRKTSSSCYAMEVTYPVQYHFSYSAGAIVSGSL